MRVVACTAALAALGAGTCAFALGDGVAQQQQQPAAPQQVVLRAGDTMRVQGADLGCQVARRAGRLTVECRRLSAVRRTYGTFIDARGAIVARFRSPDTAQVVFTARHRGGWTTCGSGSAQRLDTGVAQEGCP